MPDEDRKNEDRKAPERPKDPSMPPAGPHARKDLTNPMATPGTGSLPDKEGDEGSGISS